MTEEEKKAADLTAETERHADGGEAGSGDAPAQR